MRKIKGFKLNLRIKEVQRRAKKAKIDLAAIGLGADDVLTKLADEFSARAKPSVIYDSFSAEGAKAPLSPIPGLAYSLSVATLGSDLDAYIEEKTSANAEIAPALGVMAQAALDDATRFVLSLIEEEAKEDQCELSPIQYASEPDAVQAILSRLEAHKINVASGDSGVRPIHSCAFGLSWVARSKSRAK